MKKTIVIVDDHILIAEALSSIISNFMEFEVLYVCENGLDFKNTIEEKGIPDIVLLDIGMPIMDGYETAKWLNDDYPETLVLALSMQDDDQSLIKMVKNGVEGYMLKNSHPRELENALNSLVRNKLFFPEWATSKLISVVGNNVDSKLEFSEREIEFLKFSTTEMNYREISEKMYCSPRTIENYRDSLCDKLDLKTRVGLAMYAFKNGYAS